jgi:hypothetical protein
MSLSFALMGHPKRRTFIDELAPQIPGIEVVLDRHNDRWETGRRSLLAFDPNVTHHCVVQDDAILCRDFIPSLERAIAAVRSERPVGLYVGRVRPHRDSVTPTVKRALKLGVPWLEMEGPWWGVAIVIPTAHIPELVAWGDENTKIANYDRRIAAFYASQGIDCWYTVPSLVDHRPVDENPSLIEGRTGNRRAHTFVTDVSPLEIDWHREPMRLDSPVTYRNTVTRKRRTVKVGTATQAMMSRHRNWIEEAA